MILLILVFMFFVCVCVYRSRLGILIQIAGDWMGRGVERACSCTISVRLFDNRVLLTAILNPGERESEQERDRKIGRTRNIVWCKIDCFSKWWKSSNTFGEYKFRCVCNAFCSQLNRATWSSEERGQIKRDWERTPNYRYLHSAVCRPAKTNGENSNTGKPNDIYFILFGLIPLSKDAASLTLFIWPFSVEEATI